MVKVIFNSLNELYIDEDKTPLPPSVATGLWRVDKAREWLTELNLQTALWDFTTEKGPSEGVMRELVIDEEMNNDDRKIKNKIESDHELKK